MLCCSDGVVDKYSRRIGIGCVAYNSNHQELCKCSKCISGKSSLLAETIAIEETGRIALLHGWKKVCFFSDSKISIDYINDNQQVVPWDIYAPIIKIREKIGNFELVSFVAIRRSSNLHAHNLAKESLQSGIEFICIHSDVMAYPFHE